MGKIGSSIRRRLSYANVMSTIAVVLALGGATAVAATSLSKNSVGPKQLKKNAVTGPKVKDGSLSGADIDTSSLGEVPSAKRADSANSAQRAEEAARAEHAAEAESAAKAARADAAGTAQRADTANLALSIAPPEGLRFINDPQQPRFRAGWANFDPARPTGFFIDREGMVHLQGIAGRVGGSNEINLFTLPPGYTPASEGGQFFPVLTLGGGVGTLVVHPNGDVNFFAGANGNGLGVFLNGISWRAGH